MIKQYQLSTILVETFEDDFEEGILENTWNSWEIPAIPLPYPLTREDVYEVLRRYLDIVDMSKVEFNYDGVPGSVVVCYLVTEDNYRASEKDIEEWKRGYLRLWLLTATAFVQQITNVEI